MRCSRLESSAEKRRLESATVLKYEGIRNAVPGGTMVYDPGVGEFIMHMVGQRTPRAGIFNLRIYIDVSVSTYGLLLTWQAPGRLHRRYDILCAVTPSHQLPLDCLCILL